MEQLHVWLDIACEAGTLMFEFAGEVILVLAGIVEFITIKKSPYTRQISQRNGIRLEFKMARDIKNRRCDVMARHKYGREHITRRLVDPLGDKGEEKECEAIERKAEKVVINNS